MATEFIGRELELEQLGTALEKSKLGGNTVFLFGKTKVGKTSLVQKFLESVQKRNPKEWRTAETTFLDTPNVWMQGYLSLLSNAWKINTGLKIGQIFAGIAIKTLTAPVPGPVMDLLGAFYGEAKDKVEQGLRRSNAESATALLKKAFIPLLSEKEQGWIFVFDHFELASEMEKEVFHLLAAGLKDYPVLFIISYTIKATDFAPDELSVGDLHRDNLIEIPLPTKESIAEMFGPSISKEDAQNISALIYQKAGENIADIARLVAKITAAVEQGKTPAQAVQEINSMQMTLEDFIKTVRQDADLHQMLYAGSLIANQRLVSDEGNIFTRSLVQRAAQVDSTVLTKLNVDPKNKGHYGYDSKGTWEYRGQADQAYAFLSTYYVQALLNEQKFPKQVYYNHLYECLSSENSESQSAVDWGKLLNVAMEAGRFVETAKIYCHFAKINAALYAPKELLENTAQGIKAYSQAYHLKWREDHLELLTEVDQWIKAQNQMPCDAWILADLLGYRGRALSFKDENGKGLDPTLPPKYFERAIAIAVGCNHVPSIVRGNLLMGYYIYWQKSHAYGVSKNAEADTYFDAAYAYVDDPSLSLSHEVKQCRVEIYHARAFASPGKAKGKPQIALDNYQKAYDLAEDIKDQDGMRGALHGLGFTHLMLAESKRSRTKNWTPKNINDLLGLYIKGIDDIRKALDIPQGEQVSPYPKRLRFDYGNGYLVLAEAYREILENCGGYPFLAPLAEKYYIDQKQLEVCYKLSIQAQKDISASHIYAPYMHLACLYKDMDRIPHALRLLVEAYHQLMNDNDESLTTEINNIKVIHQYWSTGAYLTSPDQNIEAYLFQY